MSSRHLYHSQPQPQQHQMNHMTPQQPWGPPGFQQQPQPYYNHPPPMYQSQPSPPHYVQQQQFHQHQQHQHAQHFAAPGPVMQTRFQLPQKKSEQEHRGEAESAIEMALSHQQTWAEHVYKQCSSDPRSVYGPSVGWPVKLANGATQSAGQSNPVLEDLLAKMINCEMALDKVIVALNVVAKDLMNSPAFQTRILHSFSAIQRMLKVLEEVSSQSPLPPPKGCCFGCMDDEAPMHRPLPFDGRPKIQQFAFSIRTKVESCQSSFTLAMNIQGRMSVGGQSGANIQLARTNREELGQLQHTIDGSVVQQSFYSTQGTLGNRTGIVPIEMMPPPPQHQQQQQLQPMPTVVAPGNWSTAAGPTPA